MNVEDGVICYTLYKTTNRKIRKSSDMLCKPLTFLLDKVPPKMCTVSECFGLDNFVIILSILAAVEWNQTRRHIALIKRGNVPLVPWLTISPEGFIECEWHILLIIRYLKRAGKLIQNIFCWINSMSFKIRASCGD